MKQNLENMRKCPRFDYCSVNVCPIDSEANFKINLPDEECCPFTIKKKGKNQKGIKTLAPQCILEVIPESNVKLLNNRNKKRRQDLYKTYESK